MAMIPAPEERRELAELIGASPEYLHQCLTGFRSMEAGAAVEAEAKTNGRLRRWHLRTKDWHRIWPELVGQEGVPPVTAPTSEAA
jgi:DNA-binding transcriptional regulator YdaS (Cro superfamily)